MLVVFDKAKSCDAYIFNKAKPIMGIDGECILYETWFPLWCRNAPLQFPSWFCCLLRCKNTNNCHILVKKEVYFATCPWLCRLICVCLLIWNSHHFSLWLVGERKIPSSLQPATTDPAVSDPFFRQNLKWKVSVCDFCACTCRLLRMSFKLYQDSYALNVFIVLFID